jgi:hypothetical protein
MDPADIHPKNRGFIGYLACDRPCSAESGAELYRFTAKPYAGLSKIIPKCE